MSRQKQRYAAKTAPDEMATAADGTVFARIDDLKKRVDTMANTIDLSNQSMSFIRAGMAGLANTRSVSAGGGQTAPFNSLAFQGANNFGPGTPMLPVVPDAEPRQFQYIVGTNYSWMPRQGYGLLPFSTLRSLSMECSEIRLNIQLIKRVLRGLRHGIKLDEKVVTAGGAEWQATPDIDRVIDFWREPDGQHCFDDWLDMILEDALTLGAVSIFPEPDGERRAYPIDTSLWRIVTDFNGRIPEHPNPAYIQITYGRPNWWCSRERLLYFPLNPTIYNPYGYSNIEFIVQDVTQGINRSAYRTGYFTEGNVPAAFVGLPSSWSVTQIKDFTDWYNSIVQGDASRAMKLHFLPHDGSGAPVTQFSQAAIDNTQYDEWLLRKSCFAYGNSPTEFGITGGKGLGGKGLMEGGENIQQRGSISTYTQFISRIIENINTHYLNAPWAKSHWEGMEPAEDELKDAQVETARIASGVWPVEYAQDRVNLPEKYRAHPAPAGIGIAEQPTKKPTTPSAEYRATKPAAQIPANFGKIYQRAMEADLLAWRDKERLYLAKRLPRRPFLSDAITPEQAAAIDAKIAQAKTRDEIDAIFRAEIDGARSGALAKSAPAEPTATDVLAALNKTLDVLEKQNE